MEINRKKAVERPFKVGQNVYNSKLAVYENAYFINFLAENVMCVANTSR